MTKRDKIIMVFALCSVFLVVLLLVTSNWEKVGEEDELAQGQAAKTSGSADVEMVDLAQLESNYKQRIKELYVDSRDLFAGDDATIEKVGRVKSSLLALTVPKEFKNLHYNLVFALIKLENFIKEGNVSEKDSGNQIIDEVRNEYSWLASSN